MEKFIKLKAMDQIIIMDWSVLSREKEFLILFIQIIWLLKDNNYQVFWLIYENGCLKELENLGLYPVSLPAFYK